jgi:hypothetical protein
VAVVLTNLPLPWTAAPSLLDFGIDQTAGAGGVQQRGPRIGSRWAVTFSALPALGYVAACKLLAARLTAQAHGQTLLAPWPQPAFTDAIGSPLVNGAGQGGLTLNVRGLTPRVAVAAGLFFSVIVAGRNFLYQTTDTCAADAGGLAALPIGPFIRKAPADGATLGFAAPQIEGMISGLEWTIDRLAWVSLPSFTLTELE